MQQSNRKRQNTHPGMPPQSRVLGGVSVGPGRGSSEQDTPYGRRSTTPRGASPRSKDRTAPSPDPTPDRRCGVSRVFVLDKRGRPLAPTTPTRARILLKKGRAAVANRAPFTIRLKDRLQEESVAQGLQLKVDPGSRTTGLAITQEKQGGIEEVLYLAEITHRGQQIKKKLQARAAYRRRRRSKLWHRAPRFNNRKPSHRRERLPPSLWSRVQNILTWAKRLSSRCPILHVAIERVRFDLQKQENLKVRGVQYQQGTLQGYEVREYLLEKWGRTCVYCGNHSRKLQIEHIHPKARGGSDRISNLTIACRSCNQAKGAQCIEDYLKDQPTLLAKVQHQRKAPLHAAAAVNATRFALVRRLREAGFEVSAWSGGRTKFNRARQGIPKHHALDAACVGPQATLVGWLQPIHPFTASGRGLHQRALLNAFGFPRAHRKRPKTAFGFRSGDLVCVNMPRGKHRGIHQGTVAIRHRGLFVITTPDGKIEASWRRCQLLQRAGGFKPGAQITPAVSDGVVLRSFQWT